MENGAKVLRNIRILTVGHQVSGSHKDARVIGMTKEICQETLQENAPGQHKPVGNKPFFSADAILFQEKLDQPYYQALALRLCRTENRSTKA